MNRGKNWLLVGNHLGFSLDMSKCQKFAQKTWPADPILCEANGRASGIRPVGHATLLARPANHLSAMGVWPKQLRRPRQRMANSFLQKIATQMA